MNVWSRGFLVILIFISSFSLVYSFNVCNVNIEEPWFLVNDSSGKDVLIVDNQGDMYFEGEDHSMNNKNSQESFEVGSNIFFNNVTSKFSSFNYEQIDLPETKGLIIRDSLGDDVSLFTDSGDIYTKGKGVYEGSQAGCLDDGWNYCNADGITRENRDYYCDLTGSKTGSCKYDVIDNEDCSTKLSEESDSGNDKNNKGEVKDYTDCSGGSCNYDTYTDRCTSSTNLLEYIAQGSSYTSENIDCSSDDYYYCSGDNRYKRTYNCGNGECSFDENVFIETCSAPSTDYGSWSCHDSDTRVRTNVEYSASCTGGSCDISSTNVQEYDNCGSGEVCSGGSCCDSHDYKSCYNGDIYWYDSCGYREERAQSCTFGCSGSSCNSNCPEWKVAGTKYQTESDSVTVSVIYGVLVSASTKNGPGACIVYDDTPTFYWNGKKVSDSSLVRYKKGTQMTSCTCMQRSLPAGCASEANLYEIKKEVCVTN